MERNRILTDYPDLLKEYDVNKNVDMEITSITVGIHKKVWWKCSEGHEWLSTVHNRIKGNGCPYCSGRLAIPGVNSLADTNQEILQEWDYDKNETIGIKPTEIKVGSNKKVWWKCILVY